jgi:ADP-ribose pyrophosphatase
MADAYVQLGSRVVFRGRIFDVVDDLVRLPTGHEVNRLTVKHPGAVLMAPLANDGKLVMVRQYRHPLRSMLLEFPAGTLEKGEDPEACARRELAEETGFAAAEWTDLGVQYPLPGYCDELQHCFFARSLSPMKAEGDEDEIIEVVTLTPAEFERASAAGDMIDAKSVSIYARAKWRGLV